MREILFVGHRADRTGSPMGLLLLLRFLARETDLDFEVVVSRGGDLLPEFRALAPTHVLDPAGPSAPVLRRVRVARLRRRLQRSPPRLVFWNSVASWRALTQLGMPRCPVMGRVTEGRFAMQVVGAREVAALCAGASELIAVSRAVAEDLASLRSDLVTRTRVVPEAVPIPPQRSGASTRSLRRSLGVAEDAILVGAVGTLCWRKGTDLFPQIARQALLHANGRPLHFVWMGHDASGVERLQLAHDVRALGIEARVHQHAAVDDPGPLYDALDLLVLPSREDPHPLVALEAAARGVPTVCFEGAGGTADFIGKDAGVVVPYLDVDAMARALCGLADDPLARARLGEAAAQRVRLHHDVEVVEPRLLERIRAVQGAAPVD